MCSRIIICRFFVSSLQKITAAAAQGSKQYSNTVTSYQIARPIVTVNAHIPRRLYSEKVNPEDIIADYDYVKKATRDNNILIIDVREPDEIKEHGQIPNSINIPLGNISSVLSTMPDKEFEQKYKKVKPTEDTEIIFYCMIGKRSGMAQQNAMNLGYKNVKNYLGSWTEWASKI